MACLKSSLFFFCCVDVSQKNMSSDEVAIFVPDGEGRLVNRTYEQPELASFYVEQGEALKSEDRCCDYEMTIEDYENIPENSGSLWCEKHLPDEEREMVKFFQYQVNEMEWDRLFSCTS